MGNPLISVIMPVYNVEKYLSSAIESILAQTYKNFEIILVDDRSPDRCGAICDDFAEKDRRIRVIHKKRNEGLGKARETGLKVSSGEWLIFIDSDDMLVSNAFYDIIESVDNETDIAVFGLTMRYENNSGKTEYESVRIADFTGLFNRNEIGNILVRLDNSGVFPYMCNKFYRLEFLKNSGVEFNSIQSMEDFFYNIEIFPLARKIRVLDKSLYIYRKPKHETLASAYNPAFFELCKKRYTTEKKCLSLLKADTNDNLQKLYLIYIKHLVSCLSRNASVKSVTKKQKRSNVREYLNDPVTREILENFEPGSVKLKILTGIFKNRKYFIAGLAGKIILFTQKHLGKLFSRIR